MEIKEERPPYVRFEQRPEEDRTASIEKGCTVMVDVDYAIVTPQGSKDMIPRKVSEWFPYLEQQVKEQRLDPKWLVGWKESYKLFKAGLEVPLNGTAVKNWPAASPSQVRMLTELHLLTVEDVAAMNDEAAGRLGMGAMQLKQRAQDWLKHTTGPGKLTAEMEVLRTENASMKLRLEALEPEFQEMKAALARLTPQQQPALVSPPPERDDDDDLSKL